MNITGIAALLAALVAVLGVLQLFLRWEEYRFPELRRVLVAIEAILQGNRRFLAEESKQAERDLRDVIDQLRHKKVKEHAAAVYEAWKKSFASDPGPWVWVGDFNDTANRQHSQRLALHDWHIAECLAAIQETKRAMNKVERFTYPPLR